jgi:hypothetical protein
MTEPPQSKNAERSFRSRNGDLVRARWTDDGRVILRFRPGSQESSVHVVTEAEAEEMVKRGDLKESPTKEDHE